MAGLVFNVPQGRSAVVGVSYGVLMSATLTSTELFILQGRMRDWLSRFSFTATLAIRSAITQAVNRVIEQLARGFGILVARDLKFQLLSLANFIAAGFRIDPAVSLPSAP